VFFFQARTKPEIAGPGKTGSYRKRDLAGIVIRGEQKNVGFKTSRRIVCAVWNRKKKYKEEVPVAKDPF